jgi:hypothetical protein
VDGRTAVGRAGPGAAGRGAALIAVVVAVVVLTGAPAEAHTAAGPRPTNYLTTLESISPPIPGVTVHVVELGNKLQLTNRTRVDIVILGYDDEPYLRVGPSGLYENLRSPATYLNRTRAGSTPVPPIAIGTGASTPPRWQRISGSHTAIWHDHRIHWMGTSPPTDVQADEGAFHTVIPAWTVAFRYGTQTVALRGRLDWVPGPSGWPWVPAILAGFAVGFVVARSRRVRVAVASLVVLVGVDMAHTITAEAARAGTQLTKTVQFFGDNFVSVFVWVVAAVTIWGVRRRRLEALYGMVLVGAMVATVSGVSDLAYLWKSQLPTIGPHLVARAEVASSLGLGLGLAAGALAALRRAIPRLTTRDRRDPQWLQRLVAGLDDDQVALECERLVAGEVIPLALTDLGERLVSLAPDLGSDALVFVVVAEDEIGTHVWSITAAAIGSQGLRVQRGRPAPPRAELHLTFPAFVGLLAGTSTVEEATEAGRLDVSGDAAFVAAVEARLVPGPGPDARSAPQIITVTHDA